MSPATILAEARRAGMALELSFHGTITFKGPRAATARWSPDLRGARPAILTHLKRDLHAILDFRTRVAGLRQLHLPTRRSGLSQTRSSADRIAYDRPA